MVFLGKVELALTAVILSRFYGVRYTIDLKYISYVKTWKNFEINV